MGYKTYTRQDLADFTGRPLASFPQAYVENSALPQALLLFKLGTCLASPDDLTDDQKQLVDFAILSMADAIHLVAPYQTVLASPFNSETIGSYSYSKMAKAVQMGLPTGVSWFDMAIADLSVCGDVDPAKIGFGGGGIEMFENDGVFVPGSNGNVDYLSPADIRLSQYFTYGIDPAPGSQYYQE